MQPVLAQYAKTGGMESFDKGARLKEPSITLNLDVKEYY